MEGLAIKNGHRWQPRDRQRSFIHWRRLQPQKNVMVVTGRWIPISPKVKFAAKSQPLASLGLKERLASDISCGWVTFVDVFLKHLEPLMLQIC